MSTATSLHRCTARELARSARRPDIADQLSNGHIEEVPVSRVLSYTRRVGALGASTPTALTVQRWDLTRMVWLLMATPVGRTAQATDDAELILTEYDLSQPAVLEAVLPLLGGWAIDPYQYGLDWVDPDLAGPSCRGPDQRFPDHLDDRIRTWTAVVSRLRRLDPRPVPPPLVGQRDPSHHQVVR